MSKKYVSLDRLADYDALIKQEIANSVSGKADSGHSHDGRYYTETEIDAKIADINTTIENHNHDDKYDGKGAAANALASAKTYADNAAKTVKNDLLNNAGEAYDTLKELGDLIDDNTDAIDALEIVAAGKSDKGHTHNYAGSSSVGGAANSVANKLQINRQHINLTDNSSSTEICEYDGSEELIISISTYEYSNFVKSGSGAKAGLVPAPSTIAGTTKYLREDGTWQVPPDTNTTYTLPAATSSALGGVKIGNNITNSSGTISLTSSNVTTALGYTPATQTYVTEQIQAAIQASWEASY